MGNPLITVGNTTEGNLTTIEAPQREKKRRQIRDIGRKTLQLFASFDDGSSDETNHSDPQDLDFSPTIKSKKTTVVAAATKTPKIQTRPAQPAKQHSTPGTLTKKSAKPQVVNRKSAPSVGSKNKSASKSSTEAIGSDWTFNFNWEEPLNINSDDLGKEFAEYENLS